MPPDAAEPHALPARLPVVAGFTLEQLTPEHADELGAVHVQAWQEAYRGIMPAAYLAGLDPAQRARVWRELALRAQAWRVRASGRTALDSSAGSPSDGVHETAVTVVAKDGDGGIVGFISVGAPRDDDPPTDTQLWAVNLVARVHGTGLADGLIRVALGDRAAYLWVVEQNLRAQAFYRRHGFTADGAVSVHEPTGTQEIRMVRPVQGIADSCGDAVPAYR